MRSGYRNANDPGNRNDNIEVRLARARGRAGGPTLTRARSCPYPPAGRPRELAFAGAPAWASAWGVDRYGIYAVFEVDGVAQKMRWVPPGRFLMGSPPDEPERFDDELQHEVWLTRGYWLADTACTQALWQKVMGENPSRFKGTGNPKRYARRPVEQVSWDDCQEFLKRLNQRVPGLDLRLPTEAEWEYACRAGTTTPFSFGKNITTDQVNYDGYYPYAGGREGRHRETTVPVGTLPPNPWGFFEMHGNVYEWCSDWYGPYEAGRATDPLGPAVGSQRVLRGGSWYNPARVVRSGCRFALTPSSRRDVIGVRLARGQ